MRYGIFVFLSETRLCGFTVYHGVGNGMQGFGRDSFERERDFTFTTGPRENPEPRPKSRDIPRRKKIPRNTLWYFLPILRWSRNENKKYKKKLATSSRKLPARGKERSYKRKRPTQNLEEREVSKIIHVCNRTSKPRPRPP